MNTQSNPRPAGRIPAGSFAMAPDLPGVEFRSLDAFAAWRDENQSLLEARYAIECNWAGRSAEISQPGTCAPCLRPALFTSRLNPGERTPDGQRMPVWRDEMRCDCEDRLNNSQRGVLHMLQAAGIAPWSRLLLFGPAGGLDMRLAAIRPDLTEVPRLRRVGGRFVLPPKAAGFHLAASWDYLQFVPPLESALAVIAGALVAGGRFVFSVPFQPDLASTKRMAREGWDNQATMPADCRDTAHEFGWDLLTMLRAAGFTDAAACLVWSAELGLLGRTNFLFRATR